MSFHSSLNLMKRFAKRTDAHSKCTSLKVYSNACCFLCLLVVVLFKYTLNSLFALCLSIYTYNMLALNPALDIHL